MPEQRVFIAQTTFATRSKSRIEGELLPKTNFLNPLPPKWEFSVRRRILFVFAWLVVGGEETEVRLLTKNLNPANYQVDVVACFRKPGMPEQTHHQLEALGVNVDKTPYTLSFEQTVDYLANKIPNYDLVVACQAVPDVYPAYERLSTPPPLIEHGGLVCEAAQGPKHFTARYVGVCQSIRQAAANRMAHRAHHAIAIPSMVDLSEFNPEHRTDVRASWGLDETTPVFGWVGRLDRKKRVEDFIYAAAAVHEQHPQAHFVIIGGPDAFMPEYADELQTLARNLNLLSTPGLEEDGVLRFVGDRPDVPRLLTGLDALVWLSRDEGMPHVISEAGAASLPVIATCDNGSQEQITHNETGLFVPHQSPHEVAEAMKLLLRRPDLGRELGSNLRKKVEALYSVQAVVPQWEKLFNEVLTEHYQEKQFPLRASLLQASPKFVTSAHDVSSLNPKFGW